MVVLAALKTWTRPSLLAFPHEDVVEIFGILLSAGIILGILVESFETIVVPRRIMSSFSIRTDLYQIGLENLAIGRVVLADRKVA